MPKIVNVVGALLALLAGAWWWSQGPTSAPPTASESPVAVEKAPPPTAIVVDAHEAVASTPNERTAAAPTNEASPIPESATSCDVLVVDHETGNAVADADVTYYDDLCHSRVMKLPSQAERDALLRDPERIATRFGWRTRSDASGKVRVHFATSYAVVYGYHAGRFGTLSCARAVPPGGCRLELTPDRTLRVQVLDAAAAPANGVQVGIDAQPAARQQGGIVASTGPDQGIATFPHLQLHRGADGQSARGTWRARVSMPAIDDEGVEFDITAPPVEPIVLRLPATGQLALRVVHEGAPMHLQPGIAICGRPGEDKAGPFALLRNIRQAGDDGWVLFDRVPIARTFVARAQVGTTSLQEEVTGPTSSGQRVEVEISTAGRVAEVVGRLFDAKGDPLAEESVQAAFASSFSNGGVGVNTDRDGRFHFLIGAQPIQIPGAPAPAAVEEVALQRLEFTRKLASGTMERVLVAPRTLRLGRNDVGDLRLASATLVVGGKLLVDRPVWWSLVEFRVERFDGAGGRDGANGWQTVDGMMPTVESDGRFEVRGDLSAGRYRLAFAARSHIPVAPVEFAIGKADLEIAIDFGSELRASCLLPDGVLATDVKAVLRPKTTHPMPEVLDDAELRRFGFDRFTANAQRERDGVQLRWQALPADSYTLELRANGYGAAFVTIDNVLVPPPAEGDSRLVAIDLREAMRCVIVHVTAASGAVANAVVVPMPQEEGKDQAGYQAYDGAAHLPAPPGPIDLLVAGANLRPQRVRGVDREVTVALEPWPQLSLTFAGAPGLPEGMQLWVRLSSVAPLAGPNGRITTSGGSREGLLVPPASAAVGTDGTVAMSLGDGDFHIQVVLRSRSGGKALQSITPSTVVAGATALTVQLDAKEIQAAIGELQKH